MSNPVGRPAKKPEDKKQKKGLNLAVDVIEIINQQPKQAQFIEKLVREWHKQQEVKEDT